MLFGTNDEDQPAATRTANTPNNTGNKSGCAKLCMRPGCRAACHSWGSRMGWCFGIATALCLVGAFVVPLFIHDQIHKSVLDMVVIDSPKSSGYDNWADTTLPDSQPTFFQIYFFDVTNANDVLKGARPILVQKGPYSYREYTVRFNVSWSENKELLTYKSQVYYVFDPDTSGEDLSEDDTVTNINLALVGVRSQIVNNASLTPFEQVVQLRALMCETVGPTPFHTRSVRDLFWGYANDTVLQFVASHGQPLLPTSFPAIQSNMTTRDVAYETTAIDIIHTGKTDRSKLFHYVRYQNMTSMKSCTNPPQGSLSCPLYQNEWTDEEALSHGWTNTWATPDANAIWGTDGTQFPPPLHDPQIPVFVDALSRSAYLANSNGETNDDLYEIKLTRYRLRPEDLQNSTTNNASQPYYMFGPNGVMNFTSVVGFPFFVSQPHYLHGDVGLIESVEGLSPEISLHDTFIDVDNYTGISMRAAKRLQFSSLLTDWHVHLGTPEEEQKILNASKDCLDIEPWRWTINSKVASGLFIPYAWVDENEQLTQKQANEYKNGVIYYTHVAEHVFVWALVGCGVSACCFVLVLGSHRLGRRHQRKLTNMSLHESMLQN